MLDAQQGAEAGYGFVQTASVPDEGSACATE